jgi:Arc/MetJ-type ribon-helix-helix transcriptional regulator
MSIDLDKLVSDMKAAASAVVKADVSALSGFSERQLQAIAQQTAFVASGIASGEITEETRDFFLDSLKDMARSFANTLKGLVMVTIEKIWNAVVAVIWKAISDVTGIMLSAP